MKKTIINGHEYIVIDQEELNTLVNDRLRRQAVTINREHVKRLSRAVKYLVDIRDADGLSRDELKNDISTSCDVLEGIMAGWSE